MSFRYICTGSSVFAPSSNATVGATGPMITSQSLERLAGNPSRSGGGSSAPAGSRRRSSRATARRCRSGCGASPPAPKPSARDLAVHVARSRVLARAVAVAHAVEARQVGRRFGRRDHVVGGNRQAAVFGSLTSTSVAPLPDSSTAQRFAHAPSTSAAGPRRRTPSAGRCASPASGSRPGSRV